MAQIKSMTGYGISETENQNWRIKTEIKSLNNKFLELTVRLPKSFKDKDIEIRQLLTAKIGRGSVSVNLSAERKESEMINDSMSINLPLAKSYSEKLIALAQSLNLPTDTIFNTVIAMPEVLKYDESEKFEEDWKVIKENIENAFLQFD
jgi:uncharacterized protein (TIGR00255 family)